MWVMVCVVCGRVVWCGVWCVVVGFLIVGYTPHIHESGVWCVGDGVSVMWCVVCGVRCVVCGVWCVVCGVWCVVEGVWCVVIGWWGVGDGVWAMECR